jgi:hypothetical protein
MRVRVGLSVVLLALVCVGCSDDRFVDGIVIDNPTAFPANVDVSGDSKDGWLSLTTSEPRSTGTVAQVFEQGSVWIFRFSYSGYEEELELARSDLVDSNWRVEVPESFGEALRDRGVVPPR